MGTPDSSPSYGKKKCCGADCAYLGVGQGTCWGNVDVVDEELEYEGGEIVDSYWIHACDGHAETRDGGRYIPEPSVST